MGELSEGVPTNMRDADFYGDDREPDPECPYCGGSGDVLVHFRFGDQLQDCECRAYSGTSGGDERAAEGDGS